MLRSLRVATLAIAISSSLLHGAAYAARPAPMPLFDAAQIDRECDPVLATARSMKAAMERVAVPDGVLDDWNRLSIAMQAFANPLFLLAETHPDKAVRDAAQRCTVKFTSFETELAQSAALFERVSKLAPTDDAQRAYRERLLEGFEDSGIALPPKARARVKAIDDRLEALGVAFRSNIRDDPTRLTFAPDELDGLPASYLDGRTRDAQGRVVLDLSTPAFVPFMQLARNEAARKRYWIAKQNEGGERNLAILDEALVLRHELASLYGVPDFATFQLRRRMAQTPERVERFLADVKQAVAAAQIDELETLRALKASTTGTALEHTRLERWDTAFYQELLRKTRFQVDQEALRRYFPTDASMRYAMRVAETLYGIRFVETDVPVWHPDVRHFEVRQADAQGVPGTFLGDVYLDLFPREGKYNHAAAFTVRARSTATGQTPISALVTNFNRRGLSQEELRTLLHEFGHVLHGVLSQARFADIAGIAVRRDFVEAPSQMFEAWSRDPQALALFAQVCPQCPTLTAEQFANLERARRFGLGNLYATQWLLASYDMRLHTGEPTSSLATWAELQRATPQGYVEGTRFPGGFNHLFNGYAAGYYGYLWSQVLALDMATAFDGHRLDPTIGQRYRERVLARGGELPPDRLVEDFLGRAPNSDAFFKELTGKR